MFPSIKRLRDLLKAILVSPHFLFRSEKPTDSGRISDFELANRLSYFLWASMPDDPLFALAQEGKLSDSEMLIAQVDRMLDDPRFANIGYALRRPMAWDG